MIDRDLDIIHSDVDDWLGWVEYIAIMNKMAINTVVPGPLL